MDHSFKNKNHQWNQEYFGYFKNNEDDTKCYEGDID